MIAIYKRELRSYFTTPTGYVYTAIFLAINGGLFSLFTLQAGKNSSMTTYFTALIFSLIVLIPILTMKSFSEEKKTKTEQLLLTAPISLWGMVFGKFLASFTVFTGTYFIGCINFTALYEYGPKDYSGEVSEINGAVIIGSVIAVMLVGAALISIGLFVSAITENQIISALGTMGIMVLFLATDLLNSYITSEALRKFLSWFSVYSRFVNFTQGFFDFDALLYYTSISFVFMFLTVRIYEKRRWA